MTVCVHEIEDAPSNISFGDTSVSPLPSRLDAVRYCYNMDSISSHKNPFVSSTGVEVVQKKYGWNSSRNNGMTLSDSDASCDDSACESSVREVHLLGAMKSESFESDYDLKSP